MNFNQAFKIVSTWIDVYTDGIAEVSEVIDKPYGWIFFYQYKGFDPNDISTYMGGNAPIIFDRIDGEIRVTGTDQPLEFYLKNTKILYLKLGF